MMPFYFKLVTTVTTLSTGCTVSMNDRLNQVVSFASSWTLPAPIPFHATTLLPPSQPFFSQDMTCTLILLAPF